jgi:hypothetical protein
MERREIEEKHERINPASADTQCNIYYLDIWIRDRLPNECCASWSSALKCDRSENTDGLVKGPIRSCTSSDLLSVR